MFHGILLLVHDTGSSLAIAANGRFPCLRAIFPSHLDIVAGLFVVVVIGLEWSLVIQDVLEGEEVLLFRVFIMLLFNDIRQLSVGNQLLYIINLNEHG